MRTWKIQKLACGLTLAFPVPAFRMTNMLHCFNDPKKLAVF